MRPIVVQTSRARCGSADQGLGLRNARDIKKVMEERTLPSCRTVSWQRGIASDESAELSN